MPSIDFNAGSLLLSLFRFTQFPFPRPSDPLRQQGDTDIAVNIN